MRPESRLGRMERQARESLLIDGNNDVAKNCLELIEEVRYWRRLRRRQAVVKASCPRCDYEVELDPLDAFAMPGKPMAVCRGCGGELTIRTETESNSPVRLAT